MAVNPQILSYIKQQLSSGDSEVSIKNNLRSVGWPEAEISEAFAANSPSPSAPAQPIPSQSPSSVSPAYTSPSPVAPVTPKVSPPSEPRKINLEAFAPRSSQSSPMSRPLSASPAAISFTAQKPMENIFQPKANPGLNPMAPSPAPSSMVAASTPKKSGGSVILMVIMGIIIAGLAVLAGLLYKNNMDIKAQADNFMSQLNALTGAATNSNSGDLANQIKTLQDQTADLDSQLALFLPLQITTSTVTSGTGSSTKETVVSTQTPITLKGIIGGGGKLNYSLTTSKGIVVNIKNSKDAKLSASLAPFVGSSAELTGTQTAGVREITVTLINGAPLSVPAAPAPTAPPSGTSTTP